MKHVIYVGWLFLNDFSLCDGGLLFVFLGVSIGWMVIATLSLVRIALHLDLSRGLGSTLIVHMRLLNELYFNSSLL